MSAPKNRPLFELSGPSLIAMIERGEKSAIAEAKHRSSKAVKQALASQAPKAARKAPAAKPAKAARAQVAQAKAPVERKGADPVKQLRAQVASVLVPEVKPYTGAEWWDAYKATRGMTADELTTSLAALQAPVSA